VEKFINTN